MIKLRMEYILHLLLSVLVIIVFPKTLVMAFNYKCRRCRIIQLSMFVCHLQRTESADGNLCAQELSNSGCF